MYNHLLIFYYWQNKYTYFFERGILMKKTFTKVVDKIISKAVKTNINCTTSFTAFQPKLPSELKKNSK